LFSCTTIGSDIFSLEHLATLLLDISVRWNLQLTRAQKNFFSKFLPDKLNMLFRSCSVLDESVSAFFTFTVLSGWKDIQAIERMEKSLNVEYGPRMWKSYLRMKQLVNRYSKHERERAYHEVFELALDAASFPEDSGIVYSTDKRFDFLLTAAEKGARNGVPIRELRGYCQEVAKKAGYELASTSFVSKLKPSFRRLSFPPEIEFMELLDQDRELRTSYEAIERSRIRDIMLWGDSWSNRLGDTKIIPKCMEPSVWAMIRRNGVAFKPKKSRSGDLWIIFALKSILREAVFRNENACPLNYVEIRERRARACYPLNDERCVFRKWRQVLLN
jgi:hypothetical protein